MSQAKEQSPSFLALCALAMSAFAPGLEAQCNALFTATGPLAGLRGEVRCTETWDPDGAGPRAPLMVLGGTLTAAGGLLVRNLAAWDSGTGEFVALGDGVGGEVECMLSHSNGTLVVGGRFTTASGVAVPGIAAWDGVAWRAVGLPTWSRVSHAIEMPNGDLAVIAFTGTSSPNIQVAVMRGSGSVWANLAMPAPGPVFTLHAGPGGVLLAGGMFGDVAAGTWHNVKRWSGSSWVDHGPQPPFAHVISSLATLPNGDLVSGGWVITQSNGIQGVRLQRFDGATWRQYGPSISHTVLSMDVLADGRLLVTGEYTPTGEFRITSPAVFDGTSWTNLGVPFAPSDLAASFAEEVPGYGVVALQGPGSGTGLFFWTGVQWEVAQLGWGGTASAVLQMPNGDVVVGGTFVTAPRTRANCIARRTPSGWVPLGSGLQDPVQARVQALALLPNGDVVAGGSFSTAGGVACANVARWDGTLWHPLGAGFDGAVTSLCVRANGDLVAGGGFRNSGSTTVERIARWNGSQWLPLGSGFDAGVSVIAPLANGELLVGGNFLNAGATSVRRIARWDGIQWNAVGGGANAEVTALLQLRSGRIAVGGRFVEVGGVQAAGVASFDGFAWLPLGLGSTALPNGSAGVDDLCELPNGDLIAVGAFFDNPFVPPAIRGRNALARWDGAAWSPFGTGLDRTAREVELASSGRLLVVGDFQFANGLPAPGFVEVGSTCSPSVAPTGLGCPSSGGNNDFAALSHPWLASTFSARGTGLPATSLAVAVTSVTGYPQGVIPLYTFLLWGMPNCDLLVAPDWLQPLVATNGLVETSVAIPGDRALIGLVFHHQLVVFEGDGAGGISAATSTNALRATIGTF